VQALIAQQPYQIGVDGVQQAVAKLNGQPTKKKITTGFTIITPATVDTAAGKAAAYRSTC
jgi:ribose transport system substrate-binding protein